MWIPIPTCLFVKKDTRVLKVVAKLLWMIGDEDLDFMYLDGQVAREDVGGKWGWI